MFDNRAAHQQEKQCQSGYAVIVGLVVFLLFHGAEIFVEEDAGGAYPPPKR